MVVEIKPNGTSLGADVANVDLSQPIDEATFQMIVDVWRDYSVLRFRAAAG